MTEHEVFRTRHRPEWRGVDPVRLGVGALLLVSAAGFSVAAGVPPGVVAAVTVVGLLYGAVAQRLSGVVQLVVLFASIAVAVVLGSSLGGALYFGWLGPVAVGVLVMAAWRASRAAAEVGAERLAQGRSTDPARFRDGRVWATWDEGQDDCEVSDPDEEAVIGLVEALDGETRSALSLRRGSARLDVAGDAGDRLVVLWTPDRSDRTSWHRVQDDAAGEDRVELRVNRHRGRFPRNRTADLAAAQQAAREFVRTGEQAPGLAWWSDGPKVWSMRPADLSETDDF